MPGKIAVDINPAEGNSRNSEGAFIALSDGRIMFVYTKFGENRSDAGEANLVARYSSDDGETWSGDETVVENFGGCNVMSVSLLRLQSGKIAMFYLRKDSAFASCIPMMQTSSDEGKTWTKPKDVIPIPGYYVLNNDRVVQLKSGRLVMPVGKHPTRVKAVDENGEPVLSHSYAAMILHYFSDDEGETWQQSLQSVYAAISNGGGLQEPGVVELSDGRLWGFSRFWGHRVEGGPPTRSYIWEYFSDDQGNTWSEPKPSTFMSPCSPMSVKRLRKTGDLLAIWNDHTPAARGAANHPVKPRLERSPLAMAVSSDDGIDWHYHKLVETSPDHGFCYTAIHETEAAVLLGYCSGGAEHNGLLNRLRIRRIPLDEVYA